MKKKLRLVLESNEFIILLGFIIIPFASFIFITVSEEDPLYTSISRLAWISGHWTATFVWATTVMLAIGWLTYKTIGSAPFDRRIKNAFLIFQLSSIALVFIGCVCFPSKPSREISDFIYRVHDNLTICAWASYGIGLIIYSALLRKKNKMLGFFGIALMCFIVFSSVFFVKTVIDPTSYVGASSISEIYIINEISIYLTVIYLFEKLVA